MSLDPDQALRPSATWSQLRSSLGSRRGQLALLAVASILSGFTEAGVLAIVAQVAAALVNGASSVSVDIGPMHATASVAGLIVIAFALAFARLMLQALVAYLPARMAADVQAEMRIELFDAFTRASWGLQSSDREGDLQELMTNQVREATQGVLQATILTTSSLTFLVLVASAFALNVAAAGMVLVTALALFLVLRPLSSLGHRSARRLSQTYMNYASGVGEATRLAEEAHVFGVGARQADGVKLLILTARAQFFRTQILARIVPGTYQSLIYLFVIAGLAVLYATGAGNAASLGAVILLLIRGGTYGQQAQGAYQALRQAMPYMERLTEARDRYVDNRSSAGRRSLSTITNLKLEHVGFSYKANRAVLSDVSCEVLAGEAIGIIGPSGAGKSTLVQILLGLRSPNDGRYLVNGVSADQYLLRDWNRYVAYVPQEPRLLHASVATNIRFLRDIDDASVRHAAELAGIHDEIESWSNGYDTLIGPRADAVSGGQQQRLCLARALAGHPRILVLDEPASALDPNSQRRLHDSLQSIRHRLTLFIVAHNMTSLALCDRVMVVVDGCIQAFTREASLDQESTYYRSAMLTSTVRAEESDR